VVANGDAKKNGRAPGVDENEKKKRRQSRQRKLRVFSHVFANGYSFIDNP